MSRKCIDLTGQKFGRLTVIERAGSDSKGRAVWLCKCECGNVRVVQSGNLKSGHTTSCGCFNRDKVKNNAIDLTGQKFGRLTVVSRQGSSKGRKAVWLCKCECGNDILVEGSKLRNGNTTSCGCFRTEKSAERLSSMPKKFGIDNPSWKGGITPITTYLRDLCDEWFTLCKVQANYTCQLTGKKGGELHTHHLYSFSNIVKDGHILHDIEIKNTINDYTDEELIILKEYVLSKHNNNTNGVVLCKEVHILFHKIYGKGENTPEQFEEFKERYLAGEFNNVS